MCVWLLVAFNRQFATFQQPRDLPLAFSMYRQHADKTGNATSLFTTGFFYATGLGDIGVNQAKVFI
jgi:hypothetical protein